MFSCSVDSNTQRSAVDEIFCFVSRDEFDLTQPSLIALTESAIEQQFQLSWATDIKFLEIQFETNFPNSELMIKVKLMINLSLKLSIIATIRLKTARFDVENYLISATCVTNFKFR